MSKIIVPNLDYLCTTDLDGTPDHWGADQDWFLSSDFHRKAGCGPTTATNILGYLSRVNLDQRKLWTQSDYQGKDYQQMMEKVWHYITPSRMGLYSFEDFASGFKAYSQSFDVTIETDILDLSLRTLGERSFADATTFVQKGLKKGSPLAFLNYSNGKLENLDSWHWVTLAGLEVSSDQTLALIVDNGNKFQIDFKLWYDTTLLGGALVSIGSSPE